MSNAASGSYPVALLAEGVDRNSEVVPFRSGKIPSPSSRRAWIEISGTPRSGGGAMVALLAEGVDRNSCCTLFRGSLGVSPSSRRAWIEIACPPTFSRPLDVALLAEGVDRNTDEGYLVDHPIVVALLAEGVDRNFGRLRGKPQHIPSPSSRRAQVEIDTKIW